MSRAAVVHEETCGSMTACDIRITGAAVKRGTLVATFNPAAVTCTRCRGARAAAEAHMAEATQTQPVRS